MAVYSNMLCSHLYKKSLPPSVGPSIPDACSEDEMEVKRGVMNGGRNVKGKERKTYWKSGKGGHR